MRREVLRREVVRCHFQGELLVVYGHFQGELLVVYVDIKDHAYAYLLFLCRMH
jgi:hypothetical protein